MGIERRAAGAVWIRVGALVAMLVGLFAAGTMTAAAVSAVPASSDWARFQIQTAGYNSEIHESFRLVVLDTRTGQIWLETFDYVDGKVSAETPVIGPLEQPENPVTGRFELIATAAPWVWVLFDHPTGRFWRVELPIDHDGPPSITLVGADKRGVGAARTAPTGTRLPANDLGTGG